MGLFSFFKRPHRGAQDSAAAPSPAAQPIPEEERQYYRPEDYYRDFKPNGDPVITFDERRKTAYPSRGGLYPAEILLLAYCEYGTYPNPKSGYPGFWWYEYGIRNVGAVLKSLEERGFLETVSAVETLPKLTVAQLKDLLEQAGRPAKGKKAELLQAVKEQYDEETLAQLITERKYRLTAHGLDELNENEYVPYMHHHPHKTIEMDLNSAGAFHVWAINRLLAGQDHSKWREICDRREAELDAYYKKKAAGHL